MTQFSEGNRPVLDLEWLATQDACHDLLVVLHAPSSMILWNADTGTKLWKKTFQEPLLCFAFDPFMASNVTCKFMGSLLNLISAQRIWCKFPRLVIFYAFL